MAGIIDIIYMPNRREWVAKPRFSYDRESFEHGAATATGNNAAMALYNLCDKLPVNIANSIRKYCPERIYNSPESPMYSNNYKCIEVDGHCPNRDEWRNRRIEYQLRQSLEAI